VATTNVITTKSGTGFTIDVTACNLLADLTIKDFVVKEGGVITCNSSSCPNYTKTNRTTLTYTGASLPSTTIEVQRKTPNAAYRTYSYLERILPGDLGAELDRGVRWREEADLNGVGTASLVSVALPKDDAYGVIWDGDTIYPPTRNAVYDKIQTLAPKAGAVLTSPTISDTASTNGTFTNATINSSTINNSALNAACTVVTQGNTNLSSAPASTLWVSNWYHTERSIGLVTQNRNIPHGVQTDVHGLWTPGYLHGGCTLNLDGANHFRVDGNGWYRMTVRYQEASGRNDYVFLQVSAGYWNGSSLTYAKFMLQQNPGSIGSPTGSCTATFPIVWGAGVDKIISFYFQQNNSGLATTTWVFDMEVEKMFY